MGDRTRNIHDAVSLLDAAGVRTLRLSSIIETDPVGGPPQGLYLNAALKAETALTPAELLKATRSVEDKLGRVRTVKDGPRTIDIDILLYDELTVNEPDLVIPHPRMSQRAFVMVPLWEIGGV
jgi:2-amino-4-hydroxy-6-hydroxymethyldihydropteridine diphosphokinase